MIFSGDPIRTVPPASLPITLAELKAQTRVDFSDEDPVMMGYIRAAIEACENYTSMGFITQTWSQTFSSFPGTTFKFLTLGRRPVQTIDSIAYLDSAGDNQTLLASTYRLAAGTDRVPATIWLGYGQSWPATWVNYLEAVTVTYTVGYGDTHNSVPELIRQAIMMTAATFYAFREDAVAGSAVQEIPFSSRVLLSDWRQQPVV